MALLDNLGLTASDHAIKFLAAYAAIARAPAACQSGFEDLDYTLNVAPEHAIERFLQNCVQPSDLSSQKVSGFNQMLAFFPQSYKFVFHAHCSQNAKHCPPSPARAQSCAP